MPPAAARPRPDRATRLLDSFRARFGVAHELFACHAAFPAALTPELAYQLWAAFRADVYGRPLGVPWIAVADLLLSPLCAEIGEELYEMAPDVRAVLRRRLLDDPRLGSRRVGELSELLFDIAVSGLHAEDAHERTLAQAQRLTALAHSAPERAAALLAGMLAEIGADDHAGWMRMASLMEGLAEPLSAFPALAQVASAMAARGRGEVGPLAAFVRAHGAAVEVAGVRLSVAEPAPEQPPAEAPRRLSVLVAGTGTPELDGVTTWAAEELGRALAYSHHRLLTGGWPGVDHVTATIFASRLEHLGEPVAERLELVIRSGQPPDVQGGHIVEVPASPREAWTEEVLRRCDVLVLIGGAELVDELVRAAEERGKPVLPLPWTGGSAQRLAKLMMWEEADRRDAPAMAQVRARRLLEGAPRFRSDARFLVDRVMAVLALHDPASERAYHAHSRGMARLLSSLSRGAVEEPSPPDHFRDFFAELVLADGGTGLGASAEPEQGIREIEAVVPATVHWLVDDFLRLRLALPTEHPVCSHLAPVLGRHAQHLARPVIGRAFDYGSAELDTWLLRWMEETRHVLRPEEYQRWVQEIAFRWSESYLATASPDGADRKADVIVRALPAAELSPQVELLLPLLADPHPAARVAGYLVCRAFAVPVSALVLDASLRLEHQEVEERGATAALRQLIGCYEVVPGIDKGAASRLAAAGLARTERLLHRKATADAEGGCRSAIRALLEGRFQEASLLLDRLDAAAHRYEGIRRTMPSDGIHTAPLDELVKEIGAILKDVRFTPEEVRGRFDGGGEGARIIAVGCIHAHPDPACVDLVREAIDTPRSTFEQYWAVRVALRMLPTLDRRSLETLRASLERQTSGPSGATVPTRNAALWSAAQAALSDIRDLLGQTQPSPLLDMVPIPAGRFWMGSEEGQPMALDRETPRHEVELSAFELSRAPVTQRQYRLVMGNNPSTITGADSPVIDVSWKDAIIFCNAISEREALTPAYHIDGDRVVWDRSADGYRLPTEAEWEYSARGTDGRVYPWGDDTPSHQLCWNGEGNDLGPGERRGPSPVGSYPSGASPFGLMDMAGNVSEWCWDWYGPYERMTEAVKNPSGPPEGNSRVLRGGSWNVVGPAWVRAAVRSSDAPSRRDCLVGFRCARGRTARTTDSRSRS